MKPETLMKFTSLLFVFIGFVLLAVPQAQSQNARPASSSRVLPASLQEQVVDFGTESSWLFLLQTNTQWLLVIQDFPEMQGIVSGEASGLSDAPLLLGIDSGSLAPQNINSSPDQASTEPGAQAATSTDVMGGPMIFEGNTNDVPVESAPNQPTKPKPSNPSAPSS